jgi:hypothetical protein
MFKLKKKRDKSNTPCWKTLPQKSTFYIDNSIMQVKGINNFELILVKYTCKVWSLFSKRVFCLLSTYCKSFGNCSLLAYKAKGAYLSAAFWQSGQVTAGWNIYWSNFFEIMDLHYQNIFYPFLTEEAWMAQQDIKWAKTKMNHSDQP